MILHYMDDTHLEFHQDGGREFLAGFHHPEVEVLALGGDITNYGQLIYQVPMFRKAYPNAQILYVKGNHEFYGGHIETAFRCFDKVTKKFDFITFLEPGLETTIQGHRFIGATMWFDPGWDPNLECLLNDFTLIQVRRLGGFRSWVVDQNRAWVEYYTKSGKPGDIVITHHLPSWKAVDPEFIRDPLTRLYLSDVENLILTNKPKLWLHGHSHTTCDFMLGETRVLRNPFGYPGENPPFWAPKEIIL